MEWWAKLLEKDKLIRDIISGIKFVVPIIFLLFYWGFLENIDFNGISLSTITVVALIFLWGLDTIRLDWRTRGFNDTVVADKEIGELYKQIDEIKFTEDDEELGHDYARMKTEKAQLHANKIKTDKKIAKLKLKKYIRGKRGKDVTDLINEIKDLQANPLNAANVKPFNYYNIISSNVDSAKSVVRDGSSLEDNPVKVGRYRALFISLLRNVALGGATVGILWTQDPWVAITIIGAYIFSAISTATLQYYLSVKYTLTVHKDFLKIKLSIKSECKEYVLEHVVTHENSPTTHEYNSNDIEVGETLECVREENKGEKENEINK